MIRRAAPLRPTSATLNRATRTVDAVAATAAPVRQPAPNPAGVFAPWSEILDMAGADLSQFVGAPVLMDHRNKTDHLAGVIEAAQVRAGALHVTLRFATTARGDEAMHLIADGVLSGVSIGYRIENYERAKDTPDTFVARRWAPMELSLVPIPADSAARIRASASSSRAQQDAEMPDHTTPATAGDTDHMRAAEQAVLTRMASLQPVITAARGRVPQDALDTLHHRAQAEGWHADNLRAALWDAAVQSAPPPINSMSPAMQGRSFDDPAFRMGARADALAAQILGRTPPDHAREHMATRGFVGMASAILEESGVKVRGMSSASLVEQALNTRSSHTTSDFPALLQSTGSRMLIGLRDAAPSPIRAVSRPRSVPDFRSFQNVTASGPAVLAKIAEGGPVPHTTLFESSESGALATYGRNFSITRQALTNDDLGVFALAARLWASGIAETERRLFLAMFAVNAAGGGGFGPTMTDGEPLFSSAHGNVAAGSANTAGIGTARKLLREQTDLNGNLLAIAPSILLTGPTSETGLEQAVSGITIATSEATRPIFSGLRVEVEAGLTSAAFFGFAEPSMAPVLEYVTLEGRGGVPAFETFTGPNVDGVTMRCLHDVAIVAASWVGAVRIAG